MQLSRRRIFGISLVTAPMALNAVGVVLAATALVVATGCTRAVVVPPGSYDIIEPAPGESYELKTADGRTLSTTALSRVDSVLVITNARNATGEMPARPFADIEPVTLRLDQVARLRRLETAGGTGCALAVGDRVRVDTGSGAPAVGRVLAFDRGGLTLESDGSTTSTVELNSVCSIERYNPGGRDIGGKMMGGLIAGFVLGAVTGGGSNQLLSRSGSAALLGMVGATLGFAVGCVDRPDKWERVSLRSLGADGRDRRATVFGDM